MTVKRWEILGEISTKKPTTQDIVDLLLANRGLKEKNEISHFLHPSLDEVSAKNVGIDEGQLRKAVSRIEQAISEGESIVIFGDYDVDGVTGTAILWETLYNKTKHVHPYIPDRIEEGYGLSVKGIDNIKKSKLGNVKLVITVDNGIVAHKAVEYAKKQGIDVIITDHHTKGEKIPHAYAIVHTTNLCGAGVAYVLSQFFKEKNEEDTHLELAALGTVADLVPLIHANRAIVKFGIEKLKQTKRPGLRALYKNAALDPAIMNIYSIGHIIGPRLNATGRLASAMDSLRLLCTPDPNRAQVLADHLEKTNRERQLLMREASDHAKLLAKEHLLTRKLIIVSHESYQQGVIGLVAGRLAEEYYRPAIVIARGEKESKASARSIHGFNIIESLRQSSSLLVDVGGHPMAAGFTIETRYIEQFKEMLEQVASPLLTDDVLEKKLKIDTAIPFSVLSNILYENLLELSPFGMANPEPVFMTEEVLLKEVRSIGRDSSHLKMLLTKDGETFDAIGFGMGCLASELHVGAKIAVAYIVDKNTWNGKTSIQLKVKDIKILEDY